MPFRAALFLAAIAILFTFTPASAAGGQCIAEPLSEPAAITTLYKLAWTPLNDDDNGRGALICLTEEEFAVEIEKRRQEKPDIRVSSTRTCPKIKCPKGHIPIYGQGDEVICVHCEVGEYSFKQRCCVKTQDSPGK